MSKKVWRIGICVLVLSFLSAGGWYWWKMTSKPLEVWEERALEFWSALSIHQDPEVVKKMITDENVVYLQGMKDVNKDKAGTVFITTVQDKPNIKVINGFFPKEVTGNQNIIREVRLKKYKGQWLVSESYGEKYSGTLDDIRKDRPELEWKEAKYQ
jgi:hypothetical protein